MFATEARWQTATTRFANKFCFLDKGNHTGYWSLWQFFSGGRIGP